MHENQWKWKKIYTHQWKSMSTNKIVGNQSINAMTICEIDVTYGIPGASLESSEGFHRGSRFPLKGGAEFLSTHASKRHRSIQVCVETHKVQTNLCKSMKTHENVRKPTKMHETLRKSLKIFRNLRKSLKFDETRCKSWKNWKCINNN